MATTLPHIQTHHLPQPYNPGPSSYLHRPLPPTTLLPNSSYHVLKAAIKKAIPHSKSKSTNSSSSTTSSTNPSTSIKTTSTIQPNSSTTTSTQTTATIPIPHRRSQPEVHHLRPRSLSFHSPISTRSFSSTSSTSTNSNNENDSSDDEITIEMIEDEEAVCDDEDDEVSGTRRVRFGDMRKIERLERVGRLLEAYGCRGC